MNPIILDVLKAIDKVKGEDIIVYDFKDYNPMIEYAILVSGSSLRQVSALANEIVQTAKKAKLPIRSVEGDKGSSWILVDLYAVVVHILLEKDRELYQLEKLYRDIEQLDIHV